MLWQENPVGDEEVSEFGQFIAPTSGPSRPAVVHGIGGQTSLVGRPSGIDHGSTVTFGLTAERVAPLAARTDHALPEPIEFEARIEARCVLVHEADVSELAGDGRLFLQNA